MSKCLYDVECQQTIVLVDSDICVVDTKTAIVNLLGAVANIQGDTLRSPWNDVLETLQEDTSTLNSKEGLGGSVLNQKVTSSDQLDTSTKVSNHSGATSLDVKERVCEVLETVEFENQTYRNRLWQLARQIRTYSCCPKSVVEEALSIAERLLEKSDSINCVRLESLVRCFNGASVVFVSSDSERNTYETTRENNIVNVKQFKRFVEEIVTASYQRNYELDFIGQTENSVDVLLKSSTRDYPKSKLVLLLISQYPEAIRRLIDAAGITSRGFEHLQVEVACPEDVRNYTKYKDTTNYILYPQESSVVQYLQKELEKVSCDIVLVSKVGISKSQTADISSSSCSDKVDLLREPNFTLGNTLLASYLKFKEPILLNGIVIKGFGRGASCLGIPTANLDCDFIPHLVPGVYFGTCYLVGNSEVDEHTPLRTILSVGFNPHFDHGLYSVEPYIYHSFTKGFLGQRLNLVIEGFLRTEGRFDSLQGLVSAIQRDVIEHKIREIEAEMARTQKNKATEYHLGQLKAKLAKYRTQLVEARPIGGGKGEAFEVSKCGDARICLIGFPSVGKSTLSNALTNMNSATADYEFTTLTCVPGILMYKAAKIQLLDLPGILDGASEGRGRGRQVIAVANSCDLVLMILDATKDDSQKCKLERELHNAGIRINRKPPNISFKQKKSGGLNINHLVPINHLSERVVHSVLHEYKIFHADIIIREDATVDDLIDVVRGNCKYCKCIYVYNKIDMLSLSEIEEIARRPNTVVVSSSKEWNLELLKERMWDELELMRIYTKNKGEVPNFEEPIIMTPQRGDGTVSAAVQMIHKKMLDEFKFALVWGTSVKHNPQHVGLKHQLHDEDVIQIFKKR
ncbi:Developmentally-regulated G-protein 2 [Babesia sp. Xinjiang]|uniref:Developmentally-regulated G-protein 2 n=1 Tax=Babesia sp. Xinjiang TaxID=462227 RepID=UPI000A249A6E|nr:Developmentally-regulated G-protein 2 [Babesia sp. Xinjiang]ORM41151.1 Developmentally-regulated G-protein 2 [Babesia sp. Xinjiang]